MGEQDDEFLEVFIEYFNSLGYDICDDENFEEGFEKVAIYIDEDGLPCHMARQLVAKKQWTSKCGDLEDISHPNLAALEGEHPAYGEVCCIMKRKFKQVL